MSRLSLRSHPNKQAKLGLSLPSGPASGISRHQSGDSGKPGIPKPPVGCTTGPGVGQRSTPPSASPSADSWASSSDDDQPAVQQQENRHNAAQQQTHQPQKQAGVAALSSEQGPLHRSAATPALSFGCRQSPTPQRTHPISEVYEISSDDDDWQDPRKAAQGRAKGAGKAQHPLAAPASAALPECPICGDDLHSLSPQQWQQHVNACCDGGQPTGAGAGGVGSALMKSLAAAAGAGGVQPRERDTQRPCHQQQQQPPAQQLQQQPPAQQLQQQQQRSHPSAGQHGVQQHHRKRSAAAASAATLAVSAQPQRQHAPPLLPGQATGTMAGAQHAFQPPQTEQRCCKVCGADLSHLHVQQQVVHVKACMAGRGRGAGKAAKQAAGPPAAPQPQAQPPPLLEPPEQAQVQHRGQQRRPPQQPPQQRQGSTGMEHMDVGTWLKALGLERYLPLFQAQELDLSCVHAVSAEELASIGITDRLHQTRILQAADALAAQLGLRRLRSAAGLGPARQQPQQAAKKQRQLTLQQPIVGGDPEASAAGVASQHHAAEAGQAPPHAAASARQQPQQQQQEDAAWGQRPVPAPGNPLRDAGPRPQERALLDSFYPPQPPAPLAPRRTPQLASGRTLSRGTPAGAASLWTVAATCREVAPTLGARMAQREAADPEGAAAKRQPLARGGTAYPAGEESRALKRVRLEALRQELKTHEETITALRTMIAQLEREVGDAGPGG